MSILLFSSFIFADTIDVIHIHKETTTLTLFKHIKVLEDKENNLTIEAITTDKYKNSFVPLTTTGNTFGYTKSAFWVKFSIEMDENVKEGLYLELEYPLMDYITLYSPTIDGNFTESHSGEFRYSFEKEVNYRNHLFLLPKSTEVKTYYMYLKSGTSTQIPLKLFKTSKLIEHIDKTNFMLGLYYGNMTLLMLIAFIAFLKIRDYVFLSYSFYLFSYMYFQLSINGFFTLYFLPLPLAYSNVSTALSLGVVIFAGALFSGTYLKIWDQKNRASKYMFYFIMISSLVTTFIALFIDVALGIQILDVLVLLLVPTILYQAIRSFYRGYKPAKYFLFAWSFFLIGTFTTVLLFLGLVPHNLFTAFSMQIGSTLELLLLSFALINRIDLLFEEKTKATQKATEYLNQINEGLESLVKERTQELEEKNELLLNLAIRDSMTGMLNHNASIEKLNSMKLTALRYGHDLAVIMLDIDLFKAINDKYGHPAGDKVIIQIANVINKNIRQSDIAGRYGGEEFIVILHNTNAQEALDLAERIRLEIASLKISEIANQPITVSLGVSSFEHLTPNTDLIKRADIALYNAKESGRNRVVEFTN